MRTKIRTKLVKNLNAGEYKSCYGCNMGSSGSMQRQFRALYNSPKHRRTKSEARTILLEQGDKLVGWVLVFQSNKRQMAYFYIDPQFRRKGYGKRLARKLERLCPKATVCPWDSCSTAFFDTLPQFKRW